MGEGTFGQLGLGNEDDIGDDELPISIDPVSVGGRAIQIGTSSSHTCALLRDGGVRCWGRGLFGWLGYGDSENIGDDELPSSVGPVSLGGRVKEIAVGSRLTCAMLEREQIRCWGMDDYGYLGYGNTETIGDDQLPSDAPFVSYQ